jgi:hypothetical protein
MADILSKLFGSNARVKLLRLFLFNPKEALSVSVAAQRARVTLSEAREELAMFVTIKLVQRGRGQVARYSINPEFPHLGALQNLLLTASMRADDIYNRMRHVGNIKLIVVAGVFVGEWEGRIDLLIVADRVRDDKLQRVIKVLESEIGRDIRYALLSGQEFFYRLNMNDHLVRDVLDYPHRIVYDRLDIGLE